jgi:GT2 family glycosyltransferase
MHNTQAPVVSILIRSMARESIHEAVASVDAQSYPHCRLIIVNASGAEHPKLAPARCPVGIINPGTPLSRAQAANAALQHTESEFALFLDDDDLIDPEHIARLVAALTAAPNAPAAYTGVRLTAGNDGTKSSQLSQPWDRHLLLVNNYLPIHAVLFRMADVRQWECTFDDHFALLEDWDFWLQLSRAGDFIHLPGVSATYRMHLGQSGLSEQRDYSRYIKACAQIHAKWAHRLTADDIQALLSRLTEVLEKHSADNTGLREHIEQLKQYPEFIEGEVKALKEQRDEAIHARDEAVCAREEAIAVRDQAIRARDEALRARDEILNSTSFRITLPLRRTIDAFRALKALKAKRADKQPIATAPMTPPPCPIDVIVPVYKGLDETRACLESVWRSRCRSAYRLVVINDASPDQELTVWLREAANQHPMLLLENEQNLGFVGTVNRGMQLSTDADVVLLNSDTEVANDWLDRLQAAAYPQPGLHINPPVASVTPFSNNATICSYPRFCQDNALPDGYDLQALDTLFSQVNAGKAIEVPTGVGFCMFIRRACLDQIGYFDHESFGKGYGEENDFCMRAIKAGWRNLHCLDTFVWHKGSVSFGVNEQPKHVERALAVLDQLHPDYRSRVHEFVQQDPAARARMAVDLARLRNSPRPLVLAITHQLGGGTERHCRDLMHHVPDIDWLRLSPGSNGQVILDNEAQSGALRLCFQLPDDWDKLIQTLRALGVARLHWHHWMGYESRIFELASALGVPQDATLHDFYSVCPQISLTDNQGRYCGEQGHSQCVDCLRKTPAPGHASIDQWRKRHHHWLSQCARIFTPSQDTAVRIRRYFPDLNITTVHHPEPVKFKPVFWPGHTTEEPLRIAIIGALSKIKGADLLEQTAEHARKHRLPLQFRLFGYSYRAFSTQSGIEQTGAYDEEQLPALLQQWQPHLVWFPSQWPETYSYTLSTCQILGLPVATTDLGAQPERIAQRDFSWIRPWDSSASDWCEFFMQQRKNTTPAQGHTAPDNGAGIAYYRDLYALPIQAVDPALQPELPTGWQQHLCSNIKPNTRQRLINRLYHLRTHPALRGIARLIPPGAQRRFKSFILGEPR